MYHMLKLSVSVYILSFLCLCGTTRIPIEENLKDVLVNVVFVFLFIHSRCGWLCVDPLFDYGVYRVNDTITRIPSPQFHRIMFYTGIFVTFQNSKLSS
jgi:hypothetical protein